MDSDRQQILRRNFVVFIPTYGHVGALCAEQKHQWGLIQLTVWSYHTLAYFSPSKQHHKKNKTKPSKRGSALRQNIRISEDLIVVEITLETTSQSWQL